MLNLNFRKMWRLFLAGFCLPTLFLAAPARADDLKVDPVKTAALKVAYLRYVAEYTAWPTTELKGISPTLRVCVMGNAPGLTRKIDSLIIRKGLKIKNKPVELRVMADAFFDHLSEDAALLPTLRRCHVLYVPPQERDRWDQLLPIISREPIMTISDMEGFARSGGIIQYVLAPRPSQGGRMGIDLHVNLKNCIRAGLRLSSKLLNLKKAVKIIEYP